MSIDFAAAAVANVQPANANRRLTRVFVAAAAPPRVIACTAGFADLTDCVERAFGAVIFTAALLVSAALLRCSWVDGHAAGTALIGIARMVDAVAVATLCAALYNLGRGVFHLIRR